jgi:hypothetical protein
MSALVILILILLLGAAAWLLVNAIPRRAMQRLAMQNTMPACRAEEPSSRYAQKETDDGTRCPSARDR